MVFRHFLMAGKLQQAAKAKGRAQQEKEAESRERRKWIRGT